MNEKYFTDLLKKIWEAENEYKTVSHCSFNIFKILGIENSEILICRFLGFLLDPNGSHNLGSVPLDIFIKQVLGIYDESEDSVSNAKICLEEISETLTNNKRLRRIDIVIHTLTRIYPIEVKIGAGDQPNQLFDYYKHCFGKKENGVIYYLTPSGHKPSDESKCGLMDNQYKLLAFNGNSENDISSWLSDILVTNRCEGKDIKIIIEQFKEVITEMTNNEKELEIIEKYIQFDNENLDVEMVKALYLLSQNASEIRKRILLNYWNKRIKIEGEYKKVDDLSSNMPDVYKSEIVACIESELDDSFRAWLGCDKTSLYVLYQEPDGKYTYIREKDAKIDDFKLDPVGIKERLDEVHRKIKEKNESKPNSDPS